MIQRLTKRLRAKVQASWADDAFKQEFAECEFTDGRYPGADDILGNPFTDIGTALRLANHYHIELNAGMTFADCRADLERADWQHGINPNVPQSNYGTWAVEEVGQIVSIYAYGTTINEAVCGCLVNARRAGVI